MPPFIVTLAMLLATSGVGLILANNNFISVDSTTGFIEIGKNIGPIPIPVIILVVAYIAGAIVLNHTRFGRHVLAIGGNEEAARLMGLPVDRIKIAVYALSGGLASLTFTGIPNEGVGWELVAIASVVVGGTLLTGGMGSIGTTLVGVLLLGLIFNILNFESLSPYWQSVIRGAFLLVVVILQNRLARRRT